MSPRVAAWPLGPWRQPDRDGARGKEGERLARHLANSVVLLLVPACPLSSVVPRDRTIPGLIGTAGGPGLAPRAPSARQRPHGLARASAASAAADLLGLPPGVWLLREPITDPPLPQLARALSPLGLYPEIGWHTALALVGGDGEGGGVVVVDCESAEQMSGGVYRAAAGMKGLQMRAICAGMIE